MKFLRLHCLVIFFFALGFTAQAQDVRLIAPEINANNGDIIEVDIIVEGFSDIASAQFALFYDPTVLKYLNVGNFNLNNLSSSNFGTPPDVADGNFTIAWFDDLLAGNTIPDGDSIFTIGFEVIGTDGQMSAIEFDEDPNSTTIIELTNSNSQIMDVEVQNGKVTIGTVDATEEIVTTDFSFFPISPNPIQEKGVSKFRLNEAQVVQLSIIDSSGKTIYEESENYGSGLHRLELPGQYFPASGSYIVRLSTAKAQATRRVVVLK